MNVEKQSDQNYSALIMLVDDNPEFISGIELSLEMEGSKVWSAKNGQEALDKLQKAFNGFCFFYKY